MRPQHIILIIFGLVCCQVTTTYNQNNTAGKPVDSTKINSVEESNFWSKTDIHGGQLTLPFKIRPKVEHGAFRLTTDVTVGAFIGLTRQISLKKPLFLTIPFAAGVTFINLNDNNTLSSSRAEMDDTEIVPGLTWSAGLILQLERHNIGIMFGRDYASEIGDQWIYHRKFWWSFGIGFTFFN
jgi:hypothetical protein